MYRRRTRKGTARVFCPGPCPRGNRRLGSPVPERMRYDTILLLDVIEHVSDPASFLRRLSDGFPNLSHLIITVPACQELWSNYDECYGHCRRYSLEMLKSTSIALGADCIWGSYFFHMAYPVGWVAAHLAKKRETKLHVPQGIGRWLHKLISCVMIFDYYHPARTLCRA